jgi:TrmH family RNA methyltransferase
VLKRNRTRRHRAGEFFVEGVKAITLARACGWTITTLAYAAGHPLSSWARETLGALPTATHVALSPPLMAQLSDKQAPSELIAIAAIPPDDPARLRLGRPPLLMAFDRPVSPGNLGSIIRSCDALGAGGLIVTGHGADVYDPQTVRASMGSLFSLPVARLPSAEAVRRWADSLAATHGRLQIVGGSGDAERTLDEVDLTGPMVLVAGNETQGLSLAYRQVCDLLVRIPMQGAADSLNVAVAASIMLYEATRQRRASAARPP